MFDILMTLSRNQISFICYGCRSAQTVCSNLEFLWCGYEQYVLNSVLIRISVLAAKIIFSFHFFVWIITRSITMYTFGEILIPSSSRVNGSIFGVPERERERDRKRRNKITANHRKCAWHRFVVFFSLSCLFICRFSVIFLSSFHIHLALFTLCWASSFVYSAQVKVYCETISPRGRFHPLDNIWLMSVFAQPCANVHIISRSAYNIRLCVWWFNFSSSSHHIPIVDLI